MDGALRVAVFEVAAEADFVEAMTVHFRQPPKGGEFRALEEDDDGTRVIWRGNSQTEAVRGGVNDAACRNGGAYEGMVEAGFPGFKVGVGFRGTVAHGYFPGKS